MPSGGARVRSGPPPDPNALRRDRPSDKVSWIELPAAGRSGPPPTWPLNTQTAREKTLWIELWTRPQALIWERHRLEIEVALYVRSLRECERPTRVPASLRTVVRRHADDLGLTESGLLRHRWRIVDENDDHQVARPAARDERPSAKDRIHGLTVIDGGG